MDTKDRLKEFINTLGVSISTFERTAGLSNGYVNGTKGNIGSKKLDDILRAYPTLNRDWLLTGDGEMLKESINQTVNGHNNTAVAGNGNNVNATTLINEIMAQRKITEAAQKQLDKSQEQIDRLLTIIENVNK